MSVFQGGLFAGQVCLVTGGGSGIGKCIAYELAVLGATVIIAGRNAERLKKAAIEIAAESRSDKVHDVQLNIRDVDAVNNTVAELIKRFGTINCLVNNAGGQFPAPAETIKPKGWMAVIDTNLNGTWWVTQAVFNALESPRGLRVVNIIADMWSGFPMMLHTGAARAGVDNITKTLAVEWAPKGVRVNAVAPGVIFSSGMLTYPEPIKRSLQNVTLGSPSQRPGTESEVSGAVLFLLSPAAAYINGATLRIDGGSSLSGNPWPAAPSGSSAFAPYHLTPSFEAEYNGIGTKLSAKL